MAKKITTREFLDHRSLGVFLEAAGDTVEVVNICGTSSGSFVLFSRDDVDALKAIEIADFTHQGAGRGFSHDPPEMVRIPDHLAAGVDVRTTEVTPVKGFRPAQIVDGVMVPATTEEEFQRSQRQAEKDRKVAAAQAALDALRDEEV